MYGRGFRLKRTKKENKKCNLNFSNGKIYLIINSNNIYDMYVGSTTYELFKRFKEHCVSSRLKKCKRGLHYRMKLLGERNFRIFLLENYSCNSIDKLLAREESWIKIINPNLNVQKRLVDEYSEVECICGENTRIYLLDAHLRSADHFRTLRSKKERAKTSLIKRVFYESSFHKDILQ